MTATDPRPHWQFKPGTSGNPLGAGLYAIDKAALEADLVGDGPPLSASEKAQLTIAVKLANKKSVSAGIKAAGIIRRLKADRLATRAEPPLPTMAELERRYKQREAAHG